MVTKIGKLLKKNANMAGVLIIFFVLSSIFFILFQDDSETITASDLHKIRETSRESVNVAVPVMTSYELLEPKTIQVILSRIYLDGEISEEVVEETILSMEDFWAEYIEWDLIDQDEAQVVFQQKIKDISPLLKINGYFGISEQGILNIYEGKPSEEKVIQSFFQINTKKLKSHQYQELEKGIPVLSWDRYQKVIKKYKKLAGQEI
ncbi:intercompartmental signaling factor BofC [Bacillaceae bacterium IKA-2]|nr:intercompartmental signaling factor BofC [Bacillaceae bacterium IKA-2]